MCGRFVDPNLRGTEAEWQELKIEPWVRRYNVKPTQDALCVADTGFWARWWLVPSRWDGDMRDWTKKYRTFNAKIETAATSRLFRDAWQQRRCLIPVGGFYEWTGDKSPKQPHFIQSAGNEGNMWFAGLYSRWNDQMTCTIMTRAANGSMADLHHRMPVILDVAEREAWLGGSEDKSIGENALVRHYPVHRFGTKDDGPELIEEIE